MHSFSELILRSSVFLENTLGEVENITLKALETSSATIHIKNLQMISLQKNIFLYWSIFLLRNFTTRKIGVPKWI